MASDTSRIDAVSAKPAGRRHTISVVVPVLNESAVVRAFYDRASAVLCAIPDFDYELLFVDDGSADDTYAQLKRIAAGDPRVRLLKFSRNFGHQIAISAGIDHARGDCVAVIDVDLQDPPEVIPALIDKWREGFDVVYGRRVGREGETLLKRATAAAFYRLLAKMSKIQIPADVGDFRLISRRVVDELKKLREKDRFVRGLVSWLGFSQTAVDYQRAPRHAGETKYRYRKMMQFAIDGVTSFSTAPLRLATWMGYAASLLAFIYLASVVVQKLMGITVQGFATIMVAMTFLGGVQLICLGIIGEYLGRIFNEIKPRPMYIIEDSWDPATDGKGVRPLLASFHEKGV
jgi:dolichol-phosphate mannosyltransferase